MACLPPSRHTVLCGLRILRARDDFPLKSSSHRGVPTIWPYAKVISPEDSGYILLNAVRGHQQQSYIASKKRRSELGPLQKLLSKPIQRENGIMTVKPVQNPPGLPEDGFSNFLP
jgi:hypothetical protein